MYSIRDGWRQLILVGKFRIHLFVAQFVGCPDASGIIRILANHDSNPIGFRRTIYNWLKEPMVVLGISFERRCDDLAFIQVFRCQSLQKGCRSLWLCKNPVGYYFSVKTIARIKTFNHPKPFRRVHMASP